MISEIICRCFLAIVYPNFCETSVKHRTFDVQQMFNPLSANVTLT